MPIIQGSQSIAGATQVDNALAGSPFEFLPFDALVTFGITMETAGTVGDIVADVYSGSDILATGLKVPNTGNIDINRDMYLLDHALAGERLVVKLRNTTAATARVVQWLVQISPL